MPTTTVNFILKYYHFQAVISTVNGPYITLTNFSEYSIVFRSNGSTYYTCTRSLPKFIKNTNYL